MLMLIHIHTIPYHTIPYHTRPYGVMQTIPPYTPPEPYIWDTPGNLHQVMCSSSGQAPSHGAYVFHARSTSRFCICQLSLENARLDHWVIRFSGAWVHYLILGGGSSKSVPKLNKNPMMLEQNLQKRIEPTNETGNVEYSDSHSVWSRDKQQAKQV